MTDKLRHYTLTLITKTDAKTDGVLADLKEVMGEGAKIEAGEEPSLKKLAYPISGQLEGNLWQLRVAGGSGMSKAISDKLHLSEEVIRFLIHSTKERQVPEAKANEVKP